MHRLLPCSALLPTLEQKNGLESTSALVCGSYRGCIHPFWLMSMLKVNPCPIMVGWDELELSRSFLNPIPTWFSKFSHFCNDHWKRNAMQGIVDGFIILKKKTNLSLHSSMESIWRKKRRSFTSLGKHSKHSFLVWTSFLNFVDWENCTLVKVNFGASFSKSQYSW